MDCLTKAEAEERLRFAPEEAKFCPDCLTQLSGVDDIGDGRPGFYCPNEMCHNGAQYDQYGNDDY